MPCHSAAAGVPLESPAARLHTKVWVFLTSDLVQRDRPVREQGRLQERGSHLKREKFAREPTWGKDVSSIHLLRSRNDKEDKSSRKGSAKPVHP